jgi:hypothetical protein
MTDYKIFQKFLLDRVLWYEFKEKTEKNYKNCKLSVYGYFCMIVRETGQEDLVTSAFNTVSAGLWNPDCPDKKWNDLHQEWIDYLISINHKFKEEEA